MGGERAPGRGCGRWEIPASDGLSSRGDWAMALSCLSRQVVEDTGSFVRSLLRPLPHFLEL